MKDHMVGNMLRDDMENFNVKREADLEMDKMG